MTDLLMGIPGVGEVHPGMHVCALFSGPLERNRLLVPFMQEGQRHGDRCVCFIDDLKPASTPQPAYGPAGLGDMRRSGHLDVYSAPDAYLGAGESSPKERISYPVPDPEPTDLGSPLLRAAGQMSHAPCEPGGREFSAYESAVILIMAELPTVFLCLYDVQRIGAAMLADVLKVHSRVLLDGIVLDNPHCMVPPHDYPEPASGTVLRHPLTGEQPAPVDGGNRWRSLTGAEVRIAELVGTGMTNRATADELIVSPHTVDAHLKHIYQKLDIHSRAELAVLSFRYGSQTA